MWNRLGRPFFRTRRLCTRGAAPHGTGTAKGTGFPLLAEGPADRPDLRPVRGRVEGRRDAPESRCLYGRGPARRMDRPAPRAGDPRSRLSPTTRGKPDAGRLPCGVSSPRNRAVRRVVCRAVAGSIVESCGSDAPTDVAEPCDARRPTASHLLPGRLRTACRDRPRRHGRGLWLARFRSTASWP